MAMLDGMTALVTGGTKGLGAELAMALAQAGADVAVLGRDAGAGEVVAAQLRALGRRAAVVAADVADPAQMQAAAAKAAEALGPIDVLVCAAGVGSPRIPLWELSADDYQACFDVNVRGAFLAMRAVLPGMIARRSGRIVAIGGTYGHKGVALASLYASTKWALRGLVRSVALEAGEYGITANVVAPGGVEGPRLVHAFEASAEREGVPYETVLQRFTSRTALGRLVTGQEIAAAVIHLASDAGRNITGQDLIVDAGQVI